MGDTSTRKKGIAAGPVALISALLGIGSSLFSPFLVTGVVGAVAGMLVLLVTWPGGAIWLLIVSASMNRVEVEVAGATIRPEHLAIVASGVCFLAMVAVRRIRLRLELGDFLLWGWLAVNLVSSLLNAISPIQSLKRVALLFLILVLYTIVRNIATTGSTLQRIVKVLLFVSAAEAAYALAAWAASAAFRTGLDLGVQRSPVTGDISPYGTILEGNLLGSYTMAASLVLLSLFLAQSTFINRRLVGLGLLLCFAGLVASMARGAWLGFAVGALFVGVMFLKGRRARVVLASVGIVFGVLVAITMAYGLPVANETTMGQRIQSLGNLADDPTGTERLYVLQRAVDDLGEHPIAGWGTGAYADRYYYSSLKLGAWLMNLPIHVLYDTGITGALLFFTFLGWSFVRGVRGFARAPSGPGSELTLGLLGAFVGLMVAFQFSEATWLAYPWLYFGLLNASRRRSAIGEGAEPSRLPRPGALPVRV